MRVESTLKIRGLASGLATAMALGLCGTNIAAQETANANDPVRLVVQMGHTEGVETIAYSPDGRYIATGGAPGLTIVWNAMTGMQLRKFQQGQGDITQVMFSPDSSRVYILSGSSSVRIWDFLKDAEPKTLELGDAITAMEDTDSSSKSFKPLNSDGLGEMFLGIACIALSPDEKFLYTSAPHGAAIFDSSTGKLLRRFFKQSDFEIKHLSLSPDGNTLLGGDEFSAWTWQVRIGGEGRELKLPRPARGFAPFIASASFGLDSGSLILATHRALKSGDGRGDGQLLEVDARSGAVRKVLWDGGEDEDHQVIEFGDVNVSATTHLVTFHVDNLDRTRFEVLDLLKGQSLPAIPLTTSSNISVLSPNGKSLAFVDTQPTIWELASGRVTSQLMGFGQPMIYATTSYDGHYAAFAADGQTSLWNLQTGAVERTLDSGGPIAITGRDATLVTNKKEWKLAGDMSSVDVDAFDDFGAVEHFEDIATTAESSFYAGADVNSSAFLLFDGLQLNAPYKAEKSHPVVSVALSPRAKQLLSAGQADLTIWDAEKQTVVKSWKVGGRPDSQHVAWSPDGRLIASAGWNTEGGRDVRLELWDAATGVLVRTLALKFGAQDRIDLGNYNCVTFSPDSRLLLAGVVKGFAALWDTKTGRQLTTFHGHTSEVKDCRFLPGGNEPTVVTASLDGTVRLWRLDGTELGQMISLRNGDWVFTTPDYRFDTNNLDGTHSIFWVLQDDPLHPLPLEIFMQEYYTPNLLARVLKNEELPKLRSIAEITNRIQPEVSVASLAAELKNPSRANVVVHAASGVGKGGQKSGLQDLRLFRNGQMVGYLPGTLKDGDYTFKDIQLPASAKAATFTAYAFNSERIKSPTDSKVFTYTPPATPPKPHAYLLQIGVNHYQASACDLKYSANDAEKLNAVLVEKLKARGVIPEPVLLTSTSDHPGATKAEIRAALAAIAAKATPDDAFFLSFSGHGYSKPTGEFYILPSDIQGDCHEADNALLQNAISADELADWLRPIDAGEMTFILDSCYSAQSVTANDFKPGPMGSRGLGQLAYDKRIRILAASQSDEVAGEYDSLHQGLLSYVLTQQGLVDQKADWKPKDDKITLGEWLSYAADAVPKFSLNSSGPESKGIGEHKSDGKTHPLQIPSVFDFSKSDTFVLQPVSPPK